MRLLIISTDREGNETGSRREWLDDCLGDMVDLFEETA